MATTDYDIIVIGSGIGGLTLRSGFVYGNLAPSVVN